MAKCLSWFRKIWTKLSSYWVVITSPFKIEKKYYDSTGKEITEEKNGCNIHGYITAEPKIHKIIPVGGKGSMGITIPAELLPRLTSEHLKIHLLEQLEEPPIFVLTHPDKNLEVGKHE